MIMIDYDYDYKIIKKETKYIIFNWQTVLKKHVIQTSHIPSIVDVL